MNTELGEEKEKGQEEQHKVDDEEWPKELNEKETKKKLERKEVYTRKNVDEKNWNGKRKG